LALDKDSNVYVAACLHGRRGLVRVTPDGDASLVLAGANLVGVAFSPSAPLSWLPTTPFMMWTWMWKDSACFKDSF